MKKVLVFDIYGDYAHFRKFYTTTSPLTFSFPPPTTIAGILGAIYGTEKNINEHLKIFGNGNCRVALKILSPIKKTRIGINFLETKGKNLEIPMSDKKLAPRTQIKVEFIKSPKYRIYVNHKDEKVFLRLCENIKNHRAVYSVSLGLSELLANFEYVNCFDFEDIEDKNDVEISTPITTNNIISSSFIIEEGKKYFKEKIPIEMNHERVVKKFEDVIFEPECKKIKCKVKIYQCIIGEQGVENIVFF